MTEDPAGVEDQFRSVMSRFPTGVTVVTARHEGTDGGMTVNAFLSVTLEPPTVLVSLGSAADTTPMVLASRRFGVSFLAAGQKELSDRFASRAPREEKFRGVQVHRTPSGIPLLEGALATLECEVVEHHPYSTHVLVLGRVVAAVEGPAGLPLVFWRSGYAKASHGESLVMSPPRPRDSSSKGTSSAPPKSRS